MYHRLKTIVKPSGVDLKPPPLPANPPPSSPIEQHYRYESRKASRSEQEVNRKKSSVSSSPEIENKYCSINELKTEQSNVDKNDLHETNKDTSEFVNEVQMKSLQINFPVKKNPEVSVKLPIEEKDILFLIQKGRCKHKGYLITVDVLKSLADSLAIPLFRICTETSRLAKPLVKCTVNSIKYATLLCLPQSVAEECTKAAIQATTLYALSGTGALKRSMSHRANLQFNVGNFYRWMIDSRIANIVTDTAAVYLTAVMECFCEKLLNTTFSVIGKSETLTEEVFDKLIDPFEDVCQFIRHTQLQRNDQSMSKLENIVCTESEAELRTILDRLYRKLHENVTDQSNRRSKNVLYFGKAAILSLFYFTRCKGRHCFCQDSDPLNRTTLYDWLRFILYFVDHRNGMHVDQQDVLQAARLLLPNADYPPYSVDLYVTSPLTPGNVTDAKKRREDLAFTLFLSAETEFLKDAYQLIGPEKHKAMNHQGMTALAQAVLIKNEDAVTFLIANNADINVAVPADNGNHSYALSSEFVGWTPLSWAVANQDAFIVRKLLDACADVDEVYMLHETPLQLAVMIGNPDIFASLISCGANAFSSTMNYDSMTVNFRSSGSPCAFAVAAAYGRKEFMNIMLSQSKLQVFDEDLSLIDFLSEANGLRQKNAADISDNLNFQKLPKIMHKASQEALYYAVETRRLDITMDLRKLGVPWNIYLWTRTLQTARENANHSIIWKILQDFNTRLSDELSADIVNQTIAIIFDVIRFSSKKNEENSLVEASKIVSLLNEKFTKDLQNGNGKNGSSQQCFSEIPTNRPIINPKYADNSELSDIRFKIDDKMIYAHRIVLVNASDAFKRLLENPNGIIELDNVSYNVFKVLIDHMYGNKNQFQEKMISEGLVFQLETMEASLTFGLDYLTQECYELIKSQMNADNCTRIYRFAQRCGIQSLINDSELYILRNFSAVIYKDQFRIMLQRSGELGWCDMCASLATRLVEAFECFTARQNMKRHC
uniref:BTB domain-containing protein n=1 Tax=Panagrolaimus sp. JU765 TaxID=591449 RepID=A0AC34PUU9_9BILA